MIGFIVILTIFGILTLVIYLTVIIQYFVAKHAEKEFYKQLTALDELFAESLIVETKPLGLGGFDETCIPFSQAHKNQTFAINSIMSLLERL